MEKESILIVGSGLSGATLAEHAARDGYNVVVIEKRDHIGGNVYDEIDQQTGIRISKYGAHLFHTNDQEVWDYMNKFGKWVRWDHRVIADCSGQYIPLPVCIETVNTLFDESIQSEEDMKEWLEKEIEHIEGPVINSEQSAITRVGRRLYDILFKEYTRKQWAKGAEELEASVLERIPIRVNHDTRYFSDKFQALPLDGYTSIVQSMLSHPNITVKLNTAWEDLNKEEWKVVFFTGPIDVYFKSSGLPPLEYRSVDFHWERIPERGYAQPNSVVNYPSAVIPFTRSVEYKYFLHQKSDWTILSRETTSDNGEPYYPVPTQRNRDLYKEYLKLAEAAPKNVHFVGRLASYKYLNMDQAIRNAIDYYRCGTWKDE